MMMRRIVAAAAATLMLMTTPSAAIATSSLRSTSFVNGTGYLAGRAQVPAGSSNYVGFVSVTTDGGTTWSASPIPSMSMPVGVSASSPAEAWTAANWRNIAMRTTDAGVTWSQTSAAASAGSFDARDVSHAGAGAAVLVGRRDTVSPWGDVAEIWLTTDGGSSWTRRYSGPQHPAPPEGEPPQTDAAFNGVDASPSLGYLVAIGQEGPTDSGLANQFDHALGFVSTNGGSTWNEATLPATVGRPLAVVVLDDGEAWTVGDNGAVMHRTAAGTWTATTVPLPPGAALAPDLTSVDASGANVVATTEAGGAYWSTDSGSNWTYRPTTATGALSSISLIGAGTAIATGDNETIIRTSNSGVSWTGSTAEVAPTVAISSPAAGFSIGQEVNVTGTASDGVGTGVAKVELRIKSATGTYWTGSGWSGTQTWVPTTLSAGHTTWSYSLTPGAVDALEISARSTDGVSLTSTVATRASGAVASTLAISAPTSSGYSGPATITGTLKTGSTGINGATVWVQKYSGGWVSAGSSKLTNSSGVVSFSVAPTTKTSYRLKFSGTPTNAAVDSATKAITPNAYLTTPSRPSSAKRYVSFSSSGYLKPRHTAGTYPVSVRAYKRNTNGTYSYKSAFKAKASNYSSYSKYTATVSLGPGTWKLRAYAAADSGHIATYGASYSSAFVVK